MQRHLKISLFHRMEAVRQEMKRYTFQAPCLFPIQSQVRKIRSGISQAQSRGDLDLIG